MREFPKGGLIGKTVRFSRKMAELRIPLYAANASYFIILSFFPSLLLLLSLLRVTPLDVEALGEMLSGILPGAFLEGAEELILTTYDTSDGTLLGVSAVTALWAASRGIYGVLTGLNGIYGVEENRNYIYTRIICAVYTLAFLLMLLMTLALHIFGQKLLALMARFSHPVLRFLLSIIDLRFFLLLFLQTAVFTAMFVVLPNRKNTVRDSLPGALLSSCGWLIFSNLFSIYVEYFTGHSSIYGSVSALAFGMLWLYSCMSIVFYGGALNVLLAKWR